MVKGLAYPLSVDPATGNLKVLEGDELISSRILSFLETLNYERVMVPEYGIQDPLFESYSGLYITDVQLAIDLNRWVPQAEFEVETATAAEGEVFIEVRWRSLLESDAGERRSLSYYFQRTAT